MYRKWLRRVVCELQKPVQAFSGSVRVCFLSTWANSVIEWVTPIMQCVAEPCGQTAVYIRALISLPGGGGAPDLGHWAVWDGWASADWEGPSCAGEQTHHRSLLDSRNPPRRRKTTWRQLRDRDLSLDSASKHEHLHPKVFNVQNAEMCSTKDWTVPHVPFIHCVEMGGLLHYFVRAWVKLSTSAANFVHFNWPCQQSGLGSWWFVFWTSWAAPLGPYTCPSSPPGPWPPPPPPYFSGKKHTQSTIRGCSFAR